MCFMQKAHSGLLLKLQTNGGSSDVLPILVSKSRCKIDMPVRDTI
jgi:hypothetical protein